MKEKFHLEIISLFPSIIIHQSSANWMLKLIKCCCQAFHSHLLYNCPQQLQHQHHQLFASKKLLIFLKRMAGKPIECQRVLCRMKHRHSSPEGSLGFMLYPGKLLEAFAFHFIRRRHFEVQTLVGKTPFKDITVALLVQSNSLLFLKSLIWDCFNN